ncbi:MAG: universal stress protein [Chloroflexota bacterium]
MMYQSILVPLDRSERAEAILPHVEELARRFESSIIFMGVVEPELILATGESPYSRFDETAMRRLLDDMKHYLDSLVLEFRAKGITAKVDFSQGIVVEKIIEVAEKEDVDLIAMASHGRTGLPRVFYGSVAAGVLHRVDRPLLLIRSLSE